MATMEMTRPVELIPCSQQTLWGWPAVANFVLGGLGAGFYVVAVVAAGFSRSPAVTAASWLGPALVLAGFVAVAAEAGRPFRGPRVLTRVRTSWMSRELWIGGAFVLLVATDLAFPLRLHRVQAAALAVALALAQGFILRRARGVTAWDVSIMPLVFLSSALVSGGGLYLLVEVGGGRAQPAPALAGLVILLAAGLGVWVRYLTWSREVSFTEAVRPLGQGRGALFIVGAGHVAPFLLAALAAGLQGVASPALGLAGALMIGGQFHGKARLILSAGRFRPITLGGLRIQRRSS